MKENIFTVDLGGISLTDKEHDEINAAIQKAVTGVLANIKSSSKTVLFPINHWPKGPILAGLIARPWEKLKLNVDDLKSKDLQDIIS